MPADQKRESYAPIAIPPSFTSSVPARSLKNPAKNNYTAPKRYTSKKERRKRAGKTQKGALNLRRIVTGSIILFILGTIFYLFTNPTVLPNIISGEVFNKEQTCTVTRTNTTMFFETDCGRFEWDGALLSGEDPNAVLLSGEPSSALTVGSSYLFHTSGFAIPIAGTYPKVHAWEPAQ